MRKTVRPGETYVGSRETETYTIVGESVALLVLTQELIGLSNGTSPDQIRDQIKDLFSKITIYDNLYLIGGLPGTKGDENREAALDQLSFLNGWVDTTFLGGAYRIEIKNRFLSISHVPFLSR